MQSGYKPLKKDHHDYDFHKSFGTVAPAQFPATFNLDAGLWMPNQNAMWAQPGLDTIPPLPFGCTDYTQADLCADEDQMLYSPMVLENITHANANQGGDIRVALSAAIAALGRSAYFSVRRAKPLDWYDSIRLVMLSTPEEKRSVSIGIPWYQSFERAQADGVLPTPDYQNESFTWHNAKVAGWNEKGLLVKSWQGPGYADGGWCYMPRAIANVVFDIPGTCAFTISKIAPKQVQTVDMGFVDWFVSLFRNLFHQ